MKLYHHSMFCWRKTMFLSIIIPCYNAEKYLAECIESCLSQDFDKQQYEIICVDDGSSDKSRDVVRKYQTADYPIHLIEQNHGGVSRARNTGIASAKGDYIWFVDADDFVQDGSFSRLLSYSEQGKYDQISFAHYEFEEQLSSEEQERKRNGTLSLNTTPAGWNIWESIFRRAYLFEHNIRFRPDISFGEDGLFGFEFQYFSPVRSTFKDVLYFYRRNSASVTRSRTKEAKAARQHSSYLIAQIMIEYAIKARQNTISASSQERIATLMPLVRTITISAAELPQPERSKIIEELKAADLFPLFLYRNPKDFFPKKIHMSHAYMGIKGRVLDILNFYSTTAIGFHFLVFMKKLINRNGASK